MADGDAAVNGVVLPSPSVQFAGAARYAKGLFFAKADTASDQELPAIFQPADGDDDNRQGKFCFASVTAPFEWG